MCDEFVLVKVGIMESWKTCDGGCDPISKLEIGGKRQKSVGEVGGENQKWRSKWSEKWVVNQ